MIALRLYDRHPAMPEEDPRPVATEGPFRRLWLEDLDLLSDDSGETCIVAWYSVHEHAWCCAGQRFSSIEVQEVSS